MTKTLSLGPSGELVKTSQCHLTSGIAERLSVESPEELARIIADLRSNEALTFGVPQADRNQIVSQAKLASNPGAIARTREFFRFESSPGVMMFDYDPQGEPLAPAEVIR